MMQESISSLDLYLRFSAEQVVETDCLVDVSGGIYPCYYIKYGDHLKVSTSVTSLVIDSGKFFLNPTFKPRDFLREQTRQYRLGFRIMRKLNRYVGYPRIAESIPWYETWESIDKRVMKLKAFEEVTNTASRCWFRPDFSIRNHKTIIDRSAKLIRAFINEVENEFPDHHHVVLVGGMDSQLILLAPKQNPHQWHWFSAEPNYSLNVRWIEKNGVRLNRSFFHDNRNEESAEDFRRKIICGDLYSDPSHIRWLPTMTKIAQNFDHRCLFWGGTMSGPAHFYDGHQRLDFSRDREGFFRSHFHRTATWQGNYHQVFKNFTGAPYLSPYHSFEIWKELYQHIDPATYAKAEDLRRPIGDKLFGRPVWWLDENPGPQTYRYSSYVNAYKAYVDALSTWRRSNGKPGASRVP
jgi:hypothetical protein